MKKLISILLMMLLCFSIGVAFTSCGGDDKHDDTRETEQANDDTHGAEESDPAESDPADENTDETERENAGTEPVVEGHEHTYKTEWASDETYHWHICEGEDCAEVSEKAEHAWNEGVITTEATEEADGVMTYTCAVCGKTKLESVQYVVDQSGYSIFYYGVGDSVILLVEHNRDGLPVAVYYDEAIYGERNGDRELRYLLEYTDDKRLSSVRTSTSYYEIEYNEDRTQGYAVAYENGVLRKKATGATMIVSYTEDGQLDWINAYGKRGLLTQFTFGENGSMTRMVRDDELYTYNYDEQGRLVSYSYWNAEDGFVDDYIEFAYNDNEADLPSEFMGAADGYTMKVSDISYDAHGQILTTTLTYYRGDEAEYSTGHISQFSEDGKLIGYTQIESEEEQYYTELNYNEDGLLIEEVKHEGATADTPIYRATRYEYDAGGNCISRVGIRYADDGVTVELTDTVTSTYDEQGRLISEVFAYGDDYGGGRRYTYDAYGILIAETYINSDGTEDENPTTYQWIFDDHGRLIESRRNNTTLLEAWTYDDQGRIATYATEDTTNRFTYDENDRITRIVSSYAHGTGESSYTYSENGILLSAVIFGWDYSEGCYTTTTYDYTTIVQE